MEVTELRIEGVIGGWDNMARYLRQKLPKNLKAPVHVFVDSIGGDAFEGFAIYQMLAKRENVSVEIGSRAFSAASYIPFAADSGVIASSTSSWMAHNAWTIMAGDKSELRKELQVLEGIDDIIAGIYAKKGKGSKEEYLERMNEEYWLIGGEALQKAGVVDKIIDDKPKKEKLDKQNIVNEFRAQFNVAMNELQKEGPKQRDWAKLNLLLNEVREEIEVDPKKTLVKATTPQNALPQAQVPAEQQPVNQQAEVVTPTQTVDNSEARQQGAIDERNRIAGLLNLSNLQMTQELADAINNGLTKEQYAVAKLQNARQNVLKPNVELVQGVNVANTAQETAKTVAVNDKATDEGKDKAVYEKLFPENVKKEQ